MTVPVARAYVRRNVRVAAALVAGQVVLCVVIGYMALGGPHVHRAAPPQALEPQPPATAIAPPELTAPSPAVQAAPEPPVTDTDPAIVPAAARTPRRSPAPPPDTTAAPAPDPAAPPVVITPLADTSSPSPSADPSTSPEAVRSQTPVSIGDPCDQEGELGSTANGTVVVCTADAQGNLTWQPVPKKASEPIN